MAGEILKKKREDLGISVQEAAAVLKIRKDYLSFIEDDTFEKLPVPVYTVGYIRAYAKYLDVDPGPIVEFYNKHLAQPESAAIMPIDFSRKKVPSLYPVIAVLLVLAAGVFFFFHFERKGDEKAGAPITEPESPAQQQPRPTGALPEAAAPATPPETGEHTIQITAEETTWLSIQFSDGKTDEALLRPGNSKNWTFSGRATIKLGNAGGVGIRFDGEDLGTPGDPGEVMTMTLPEGTESAPTSP